MANKKNGYSLIEYLENYEKIKHQFNELDGIITDSELLSATKKLK